MKLNSKDPESLKKSSGEYAESVGIKLNSDRKVVANVVKGLLAKKEKFGDIHCPCRVSTGDKKKDVEITCPCVFHRGEIELQGHCKCNLFVS